MTWLADTWQMIRRNLLHIRRTPELLLDVTLSPIMFVLLFNFVFGGAISVRGQGGSSGEYINFLMAGIFVQTIAFAGIYTGVLLANSVRSFTLQGDPGPTAIPAILWSLGVLAVCFPLGLWLYGRRTTQ